MARDAKPPARRSRVGTGNTPKRPSRLRLWLRRRRGLARPAGLALLGAGLLVAAAIGVVAINPYGRITALWESAADIGATAGLQIRQVILEGSRNTPPELVREALDVRRGDPILAFDPHEAKERLELIAWVRTATVERHLNGIIRIKLEERQPFAIWQRDGQFSVIDRAGNVVTTESIGAFGRLPLIVGAGAERSAAPIIDQLQAQPEVQERVHALVRVAERRWNLKLRNGADVMLPENQEAAAIARLAELQSKQGIMDRPLAAIDMRLPDKLVLRMTGAPAPPEAPPALQRVRSGRG